MPNMTGFSAYGLFLQFRMSFNSVLLDLFLQGHYDIAAPSALSHGVLSIGRLKSPGAVTT